MSNGDPWGDVGDSRWETTEKKTRKKKKIIKWDVKELEAKRAWQAEMLERVKPFLEHSRDVIASYGSVLQKTEIAKLLSDLEKGPQ